MNEYIKITKGASYEQRIKFLKIKEPYVKVSWERYINNLNKQLEKKKGSI